MTDEVDPPAIEAIRSLTAYNPPRPSGPIDLDLSSNEGSIPPRSVVESLETLEPAEVRRYPDLEPLRESIADYHGVDPVNVLATAGGDQALEVACRAFLEPGRTLVTHRPTFEMLERYPHLLGADHVAVDWQRGPFPLERFLDAIDASTTLGAIVTPNNPTGIAIDPDTLDAAAAGLAPGVLLLDLAYVEFADVDLTQRALEHGNVVVIRTFSKALGLAGLRVGYALGSSPLIELLERVRNPFPIATPSIVAAMARLDGATEDVDRFIEAVRTHRDSLIETFDGLGARPYPSTANFVLVEVNDARWLFDGLAGFGIKTRLFPDRPNLEDHLRITVTGDPDELDHLDHAIESTLNPGAILLDMDGVLADVRESYRRAIIDTADHFGLAVTHEAIDRRKREGDANDDWELTHGLLAEAGINVDFETVKAEFETRYLGDRPDLEPLYARETLIPTGDFGRLAERIDLGVVTGRPRRDAERFLAQHDLDAHIEALICKEDAAHKPDPAPVETALAELGCNRAWLVGDTPDDIVAARRGTVLPLGVVPPGVDAEVHRETLLRTGAARVLDRPSTLADDLLALLEVATG